MKNLFRFNMQTKESAYSKLVVRSVSEETTAKQDSAQDELQKLAKSAQLPLWLRIIGYICGLAGIILLGGVLRAIGENVGDEKFGQMWDRFVSNGAIIMIVVGVICLAVAIGLLVWGRVRNKKVLASPEYQAVISDNESANNGSYAELGVPEGADSIDILCFPYKLNRKGKEKNGCQFAQYVPINYKVFKQDDSLYFADVNDLMQIPLSAVKDANYIPKRVAFYGWTKDDNFNSPKYKPYKIRANNVGALFMKGYISVSLLLDGEENEIIIPLYEQDVIEKYVPVNYTVG